MRPTVEAVADAALTDLNRISSAPADSWEERSKDNGIVIHSRKSDDKECAVEVLRLTMILEDSDLPTVLAILSPWLPYRTQFDEMLQEAVVLEELSNGLRLIRHITKKKFPFSSRDSVDAVLVRLEPSRVVMVSRSLEHPSYPPTDSVVRTNQHLGAYVLTKQNDHAVKFEMFFQCDLNISTFGLIRQLVEKAKPKFMMDKGKSLRKAVRNIKVDPAHLQQW